MEFLPGAFEQEWERRRASLLHEMQRGQLEERDLEVPRTGGVARLSGDALGGHSRIRRAQVAKGLRTGSRPGGRSMGTRFRALARGSQPAVVKLASYGGGARAGAMMSYMARGGELAVENERGERIVGKEALAAQRAAWEDLFDHRADSRDLGVFHVTIAEASRTHDHGRDAQIRAILGAGFGERRYVYAVEQSQSDALVVSGVVVLRDRGGQRLTGDSKAAALVQQRYDESEGVAARFRFHGYGNGVAWGAARVRDLVARPGAEIRDEGGRLIETAQLAGDLVQKTWRKELHSRKGRDVMHLIVSARAGTDARGFEVAVRNFLGEHFANHRYMFAIHDPALDPKTMSEGGKRPHIHAHAIVTMRSQTRERIVTNPQVFGQWRALMAEKAREQGIDMEFTDRRELASAPAYSRNQVRPVSYRGRTEHDGTSEAASARYETRRSNRPRLAGSDRSRAVTAAAASVWDELATAGHDSRLRAFALLQRGRLNAAEKHNQIDIVIDENGARIIKKMISMLSLLERGESKEDKMREMTRPEFEVYQKRVESVLASVEQTLGSSDRADFDAVAAAAREVVGIRREYLEGVERQATMLEGTSRRDSGEQRDSVNAQWDTAVAMFGAEAVERANEILIQVDHYRDGLDRIEAGELPQRDIASYQAGLAREVRRAAEIAVNDDNQYMRNVARTDSDLQRAIELIEVARDAEQRIANGGDEQVDFSRHDADALARENAGLATASNQSEPSRETPNDSAPAGRQAAGCNDRPASRPGEHQPGNDVADRRQVVEREAAQRHASGLRQTEHEIEDAHRRERDDRER